MTSTRLGSAQVQFLDPTTGKALSLGKVHTYEPGTTTDKTAWQDEAKASPHANPVILGVGGNATIFLDGEYDLEIRDAANTLVQTISDVFGTTDEDDIQGLIDASITASSVAHGKTDVTSNTTLTTAAAGNLVKVDATSAPVTVTLPAPAPMLTTPPIAFMRVDDSVNNARIVPASGTIAGKAEYNIPRQYDAVVLRSDGVNWQVDGLFLPLSYEGSGVRSISVTTTLDARDKGKVIEGTAALTLNLIAAATLGNGFFFFLDVTAGTTTSDPAGAETIDGNPTKDFGAGTFTKIYTDGINWYSATIFDPATVANFRANVPNRVLTTDVVASAGDFVALTEATPIVADFGTFFHAKLTLTQAGTLGPPSNAIPGRTGLFEFTQDATGAWAMSYDTAYKFPGDVVPTLSTAPNAVDLLQYVVRSNGDVVFSTVALAVA